MDKRAYKSKEAAPPVRGRCFFTDEAAEGRFAGKGKCAGIGESAAKRRGEKKKTHGFAGRCVTV